ncbi:MULTISPECIES: PA0069 family radical SAM protein [unclassified Minwuia]|uniref:PA0069 family radical SAM protein n=1 Tax=unclassified Minwuia TaxID=2618799 RepID=UPI00247973B3|nr:MULTISPECIES: PA0069 family radical SAM protein [unclassified Minwuia]
MTEASPRDRGRSGTVDFDFTTRAAPDAVRGRGARSNAVGRYESEQRLTVDDGWGGPEEWQGQGRAIRTQVSVDSSRSIIARNTSPDLGFDRSINPYRGCEHGCIYCFARPSHAYLGLSPGLDFETRLFMKPEAARLLEAELHRPGYDCRTIAMGTNTDPYQPLEREHGITRSVLQVLQRFNHPVGIVTKSDLIRRDIDILSDMATRGLAKVAVSVTTLDAGLARRMEPRAATPRKRLDAVRALSDAGIPVGVLAAPMIPSLNEPELERILEASREAGATEAGYIMLRLPLEIADLFGEWLEDEVPNRAARIMKLVREMRGGRAYDARFGLRMVGTGPYAALVAKRFRVATARLGLNARRLRLDPSQFAVPPAPGDQLRLL